MTSRRGSIVLRANITTKTTRGVVFIPFHFFEAAANILTNDVLDPQAKIPEYKVSTVRIRAAQENELVQAIDARKRGRY
jgi:predicted molibdopterin-dependent oxidoreductase YjgC